MLNFIMVICTENTTNAVLGTNLPDMQEAIVKLIDGRLFVDNIGFSEIAHENQYDPHFS